MVPSKSARSSSVKHRRSESPLVKAEAPTKTQKLPTTSSSIAVPPTPAVIPVIPAPAPIVATPIPTPTPAVVKVESAEIPMEDAKQDTVDILTKKLKAVLKGIHSSFSCPSLPSKSTSLPPFHFSTNASSTETDPRRLAQRQKQIDYGKATAGYKDYTKLIAK